MNRVQNRPKNVLSCTSARKESREFWVRQKIAVQEDIRCLTVRASRDLFKSTFTSKFLEMNAYFVNWIVASDRLAHC